MTIERIEVTLPHVRSPCPPLLPRAPSFDPIQLSV